MMYSEMDGVEDLVILTGQSNMGQDNIDYLGFDGVEDLAIVTGQSNMGQDNIDYLGFDGSEYDEFTELDYFGEFDDFEGSDGEDEFSYALGRRRSGRRKRRSKGRLRLPKLRLGKRGGRRRKRGGRRRKRGGGFGGWIKDTFTTPEGRERRKKRRAEKSRITQEQTDMNRKAIEAASKDDGTAAMLAAIAAPAPAPADPAAAGQKNIFTTKNILIGVGVLVVGAIMIFAVRASMKSGGKAKAKTE